MGRVEGGEGNDLNGKACRLCGVSEGQSIWNKEQCIARLLRRGQTIDAANE
ncbi:hypothetical protein [Thermoanaerobacterium sp. DL9XJH110]|uniref:hypothetical protein n=1 Tax=Thermoanaerobacterium sp. DL9XJH110 TaxID=3386643 RepID=UPI003BB8121B